MKKKTIPKQSPINKNKANIEISSSTKSFYVVGIGSSAGGLDALERFFGSMPESSGMAFIKL